MIIGDTSENAKMSSKSNQQDTQDSDMANYFDNSDDSYSDCSTIFADERIPSNVEEPIRGSWLEDMMCGIPVPRRVSKLTCLLEGDLEDWANRSKKKYPLQIQAEEAAASRHKKMNLKLSLESLPEEAADTGSEKIMKNGKFWKLFKPLRRDTLYGKILHEPSSVQGIVADLLKTYERRPQFAIESILQFFIDVAGYQHLDIKNIYCYEEGDPQVSMDHLHFEVMDPKLTQFDTFFIERCYRPNAELAREAVFLFISHLILTAESRGILYDNVFPVRIFGFLKSMSSTCIRSVLHTGIIFNLKFLTSCAAVYAEIQINLAEYVVDKSERALLKWNRHWIMKHIQYLYDIFSEHFLLSDKGGSLIRAECAREMETWIIYIPDFIILKKNCLRILVQLIQDPSEEVRSCAITTFKQIVSAGEYNKPVRRQIKRILPILLQRMDDLDCRIAVEICDIFTELLAIYPAFVETFAFERILPLICHENTDLAVAAGYFIVSFARHDSNGLEEKILCNLAKLSGVWILKKNLPQLIEVLLPLTPEMQNFDLFMEILCSDLIRLETRILLLHFLKEIIFHLMSSSPGEKKKPRQLKDSERILSNEDMVDIIVPEILDLLGLYSFIDDAVIAIFNILASLDYSCVQSNHNIFFKEIIREIRTLIWDSNNISVIEAGFEVIFVFSEKVKDFRSRALALMKHFAKSLTKHYYILAVDKNKYESQIISVTLKLSKMFTLFDLTEFMEWDHIFSWNLEMIDIAKNFVVCSRTYLIWSLMAILEEKNGCKGVYKIIQIEVLAKKCRDFMKKCFDILEGNVDVSFAHVVFRNVCDFLFDFHIHLEDPVWSLPEYKSLKFQLENDHTSLLFDFFNQHIVKEEIFSLTERQQSLAVIIELIFAGILPLAYLTKVFSFYVEQYTDFSPLFDSLLEHLLSQDSLPSIIGHMLIDSCTELLQNTPHIDLDSEQFQTIHAVAKKLSLIKELSAENIMLIVNLILDFICKDEKHYQFLYLMEYFAQQLPTSEKKSLLQKLQKLVPHEDEQENAIHFFSQLLRTNVEFKSDKSKKKIANKTKTNESLEKTFVQSNINTADTDDTESDGGLTNIESQSNTNIDDTNEIKSNKALCESVSKENVNITDSSEIRSKIGGTATKQNVDNSNVDKTVASGTPLKANMDTADTDRTPGKKVLNEGPSKRNVDQTVAKKSFSSFESEKNVDAPNLNETVKKLGLSVTLLKQCVDNPNADKDVAKKESNSFAPQKNVDISTIYETATNLGLSITPLKQAVDNSNADRIKANKDSNSFTSQKNVNTPIIDETAKKLDLSITPLKQGVNNTNADKIKAKKDSNSSTSQKKVNTPMTDETATKLGLSVALLKQCVDNPNTDKIVAKKGSNSSELQKNTPNTDKTATQLGLRITPLKQHVDNPDTDKILAKKRRSGIPVKKNVDKPNPDSDVQRKGSSNIASQKDVHVSITDETVAKQVCNASSSKQHVNNPNADKTAAKKTLSGIPIKKNVDNPNADKTVAKQGLSGTGLEKTGLKESLISSDSNNPGAIKIIKIESKESVTHTISKKKTKSVKRLNKNKS